MSSNLANRSFNVRITYDEAGEPVIGAVLGFFAVDSECYDIKPVPAVDITAIALSLGIQKSSKSLEITRKIAKENASRVERLA